MSCPDCFCCPKPALSACPGHVIAFQFKVIHSDASQTTGVGQNGQEALTHTHTHMSWLRKLKIPGRPEDGQSRKVSW